MNFVKTPVKGMNDFLPRQMRLRQRVLAQIRKTYASFGFNEIETPAMEHIENLTGKQGGENEKLIFKVMRRGAELERAKEKGDELADSGLRYDLTLPLSRFYAANSDQLTAPFKALQIGNVWRADRPQKGRFRQFMQCDIDILGDSSLLAEIELVTATSTALTTIFEPAGVKGFTVHINDRRILKAMALYAGFSEENFDSVFIILDKLDKIGLDGVRAELLAAGFDAGAVEKYTALFARSFAGCAEFCEAFGGEFLEESVISGIDTILGCVRAQVSADVTLLFDPTLVRGMSYYTGTIFEVTMDQFSFSIAGGGRYDEMIGKFSGQKVPACGFSIGFERIITILSEMPGIFDAESGEKIALLVENGASAQQMNSVFARAAALRAEGKTVTVQPLKKNAKFQIDRLSEDGYGSIERIYNK